MVYQVHGTTRVINEENYNSERRKEVGQNLLIEWSTKDHSTTRVINEEQHFLSTSYNRGKKEAKFIPEIITSDTFRICTAYC